MIIISEVLLILFDRGLALGITFLFFLTTIIFLLFSKLGIKNKKFYLLFIITLLIHLGAVLFIHYANFQPFSGGGGDYILYQRQAKEIAGRVSNGNFSLKGTEIFHYYPVIIGYIYALTLPEMIVGQLFGVWLAAISAILVYLIVLEIGGSEKQAFNIGLIISVYPSYLFYGSLLLKDVLVTPLALGVLFLVIKLIKNLSWENFLIFYIVLASLIHFRFYIGYAVIFTFIFCWLFLSQINLSKRITYGIVMVFFLGFLPQISGYGYFGRLTFKAYLNPETITAYRESNYTPINIAYNPAPYPVPSVLNSETPISETPPPCSTTPTPPSTTPTPPSTTLPTPCSTTPPPPSTTPPPGAQSTIVTKTEFNKPIAFLGNYLKSFIFVLLGPFPWQIKYERQYLALIETIPWYVLVFFSVKEIKKSIQNYRKTLPLILFGFGVLAVLALFTPNFGIITRIRIPAFISLLCAAPPNFNYSSLKNKYFNIRRKILSKVT